MTTEDHLRDILEDVQPDDRVVAAARARRDEVRRVAARFRGALRHYGSGSLQQGTAIGTGLDADCGVVLDRRTYSELGPDGEGPRDTVNKVRNFLREELKDAHPEIRFRLGDRSIKITFHEPVDGSTERTDDNDPTVDLIVALTHPSKGLFIPKKIHGMNTWDRSHPEKHNELLKTPKGVRYLRQEVTRLFKAWNKQYDRPVLSSFNITVLVWEAITERMDLAEALHHGFSHAASSLERKRTEDPAGVSGPIKFLLDKQTVLYRVRKARGRLKAATDAGDDDCAVRSELSKMFPGYIEECDDDKHRLADYLRQGMPVGVDKGRLTSSLGPSVALARPRPRAYGQPAIIRPQPRSPLRRREITRSQLRRFERRVRYHYPSLRRTVTIGYISYEATMSVEGYEDRIVTVELGRYISDSPRIRVDGPGRSPHRYSDGSLCIWYPDDPPERRWKFSNGLMELLILVQQHLFKEAWWRESGEWLGPEVPH